MIESKFNLERRIKEVQRIIQTDHTNKEVKKHDRFMKPSQANVLRRNAKMALLRKINRKSKSTNRRNGLSMLFQHVK